MSSSGKRKRTVASSYNQLALTNPELSYHENHEELASDAYDREFYTIVNADNVDGPVLRFELSGKSQQYIDLSLSYLHLELSVHQKGKIEKLTLEDATQGKHLEYANQPLHTMWSRVDVELNHKFITDSSPHYHYLAMLNNLLGYGQDAKDSRLLLEGFVQDEPGQMMSAANPGFVARNKWIGEDLSLYGCLNLDIMKQDTLLPDGVTVTLKLTRAPVEFILNEVGVPEGTAARGEFEVKIKQARWFVRKKELTDSTHMILAQTINTSPFVISTRKQLVFSESLPAQTLNHKFERLINTDSLPRWAIVCMTRAKAYNGSLAHNPFQFETFGLSRMTVYVNGVSVPVEPYSEKDLHRAYLHLMEAVGAWRQGT